MSDRSPFSDHVVTCPIAGWQLIEASAGTGKTYQIQTLYLRLVLVEGMAVERILVVTFTEAATAELRDRLRSILADAYAILHGQASPDLFAHERAAMLTADLAGKRTAADTESERRRRIRQALQAFDQAAIFTIHGFCSRMLATCALECGTPFDAELSTDTEGLLTDAARDLLRRHLQPLPPLADALYHHGGGPDIHGLAGLARTVLARHAAVIHPAVPASPTPMALLAGTIANLQRAWGDGTAIADAVAAAADEEFPNKDGRTWMAAYQALQPGFAAALADGLDSPSLIGLVNLFTTAALDKATGRTRKKERVTWQPPPAVTAVSAACDELLDFAPRMQWWLLGQLQPMLHTLKQERRIQTFDDLLLHLRAALPAMNQPENAILQAIQTRFAVALIDEFQDTDPVQYDIFRRGFQRQAIPVLVVGDPKQSIYSFRSADLHTYFAASNRADAVYDLLRNYRAQKGQLAAVNRLFAEAPDTPAAFATPDITYRASEAAKEATTVTSAILVLIDTAKQTNRAAAETLLAAETARQVARELASGMPPGDIAVLVFRHREAQCVRDHLARRGIPAVLQSAGSLLASREAQDLAIVLDALLEPNNTGLLRTALMTPFFGFAVNDLAGDDAADMPEHLARAATVFAEAAALWQRDSLMRGCFLLIDSLAVAERLLELPQGERRLTNLLHLLDFLQQAIATHHYGPRRLRQWLTDQITDPDQEAEIRLDSDRKAVQILTVFRSKGLQFPVVIVPFGSLRPLENSRTDVWSYHGDAPADGIAPLVLDLDTRGLTPDRDSRHARHLAERLQEDLRLLYVALTRAELRTIALTMPVASRGSTAFNAWHYLLARQLIGTKSPADVLDQIDGATLLSAARVLAATPVPEPGLQVDEAAFAEADADRIRLSYTADAATAVGPARKFSGQISSRWRILSFSSLLSTQKEDREEGRDLDRLDQAADPLQPPDIFGFPAGVQTGQCFHAILELLDFATGANARPLCSQLLTRYGLLPTESQPAPIADHPRLTMVLTMIEAVRTLRFTMTAGERLDLSAITAPRQMAEMEFMMPIPADGLSLRLLCSHIISSSWQMPDPIRHQAALWADSPAADFTFTGMLRGFIDLVFEQNGRYYIIDWKSNCLDRTPDSFTPDRINHEIAHHAYFIQYLLYSVALDRHLQNCLPDYNYDRHFGGIAYIFLRGAAAQGPNAVHTARPPRALIRELL